MQVLESIPVVGQHKRLLAQVEDALLQLANELLKETIESDETKLKKK